MPNFSPTLLLYLHHRIEQKASTQFKSDPDSDQEFYGYGEKYDYDPKKNKAKDSLKKFICLAAQEEVSLADFNGEYLSKKRREAEQWTENHQSPLGVLRGVTSPLLTDTDEWAISIEDKYLKLFLAYIGEKNFDALVERYKKDGYEYYVAYYLSIKHFMIKNVVVKISKYRSPRKSTHLIEVTGFHSQSEGGECYFGDASFEDRWLHARLRGIGIAEGNRMNIMAGVSLANPKAERRFESNIRASFQVPSMEGDQVINAETFWVKVSREQIAKNLTGGKLVGPVWNSILDNEGDNGRARIVAVYLALHRNTFAFGSRIVGDLENLTVRKTKYVKYYLDIAGRYRVLNFTSRMHLIQSRFEITRDGLGELYTPSMDRTKQSGSMASLPYYNVFLDVSSLYKGHEKLVFLTFGKDMNVINAAMFDAPSDDKMILNGVFISLLEDKGRIATQYMVMKREDSISFDPTVMKEAGEIEAFIMDNKLQNMHHALRELCNLK